MIALRSTPLASAQITNAPSLLMEQLSSQGLAIVNDVEDAARLIELSQQLGPLLVQEDTDAYGVKTVEPAAALRGSALHTDRASMDSPPELVWILCGAQAQRGGQSTFVDMKRVVEHLRRQNSPLLDLLQTPQSVCYGVGQLARLTQILNIDEDGHHHVRFRYDRWGFYSPALLKVMPQLLSLLDRYTSIYQLQAHQSYVVQNGRWLHGAMPAAGGPRQIFRTMIRAEHPSLKLGWRAQ